VYAAANARRLGRWLPDSTVGNCLGGAALLAGHEAQPGGDVLGDGHGGERVGLLKHHAEVPADDGPDTAHRGVPLGLCIVTYCAGVW
jgi:hypothetical protein